MRQRQVRDPRRRCQFGGVQACRRRRHCDHFATRPDRRTDPDVTVLAVDDAMMTDLHYRKAHHLIAPDSVPAPLLFPPVTHSGTPIAPMPPVPAAGH